MSKLVDYEITAGGANLNATSPGGAPEGMAPSGVNNTMREFQAANARDYKNRQGVLSAGGTSSAYTITSHESLAGDAFTTGEAAQIIVQINKKNQANATLALDGMAAAAIHNSNLEQLRAGEITAGALASFSWNPLLPGWQLMNERATTEAVLAADDTTFIGSNVFEGSTTFSSSVHTVAAKYTHGINGIDYMDRLNLAASVASDNLTINVKAVGGTDPSATNTIGIAFRSHTTANGTYQVKHLTSDLDITISGGATLGFSNSEENYIYTYGLLNSAAGTVELAVTKKPSFNESELHTTIALDVSSDDESILYSNTARTKVPIRLLGRVKVPHGVGVWDSAPTEIGLKPENPIDLDEVVPILSRAAAWGQFKGSGTATIIAGYNFASLDDSGVGNYVIHFTNPMASAGYVVLPYNLSTRITANERTCDVQDLTTTSFRLRTGAQGDSGVGGAVEDASLANFVVYGKLA